MLFGVVVLALSLIFGFSLAATMGNRADRARVVVANRTEPVNLRR